jgi:hypothetical protein
MKSFNHQACDGTSDLAGWFARSSCSMRRRIPDQ